MKTAVISTLKRDPALIIGIIGLLVIGLLTLRSIASDIFPVYYIYVLLGVFAFFVFSQIEFEILSLFSKHLYVLSIFFLILPLFIGEVTRGAMRWIQISSFTIQPTEFVRPFLILFFANFLVGRELTVKLLAKAILLSLLPVVLILLQPSLGVAALTMAGFFGVGLSLKFNKKLLLFLFAAAAAVSPLLWFILAPYQKQRIMALVSPVSDPSGAGYNSIQSMIAVGSGQLSGRGLGEGVQTQLYFLPERHSDFVFASIAEELGFVGAALVTVLTFFVLYRIVVILENAVNPIARAFAAGVFVTLFSQVLIHIGMNMGLLPITGQPLPLVSAGGSSLVASLATFGMLMQAKKKKC